MSRDYYAEIAAATVAGDVTTLCAIANELAGRAKELEELRAGSRNRVRRHRARKEEALAENAEPAIGNTTAPDVTPVTHGALRNVTDFVPPAESKANGHTNGNVTRVTGPLPPVPSFPTPHITLTPQPQETTPDTAPDAGASGGEAEVGPRFRLAPFLEAYREHFGPNANPPAGRFGRVFKRLCRKFGEDESVRRYRNCLAVKGDYGTPEELESKWDRYAVAMVAGRPAVEHQYDDPSAPGYVGLMPNGDMSPLMAELTAPRREFGRVS